MTGKDKRRTPVARTEGKRKREHRKSKNTEKLACNTKGVAAGTSPPATMSSLLRPPILRTEDGPSQDVLMCPLCCELQYRWIPSSPLAIIFSADLCGGYGSGSRFLAPAATAHGRELSETMRLTPSALASPPSLQTPNSTSRPFNICASLTIKKWSVSRRAIG